MYPILKHRQIISSKINFNTVQNWYIIHPYPPPKGKCFCVLSTICVKGFLYSQSLLVIILVVTKGLFLMSLNVEVYKYFFDVAYQKYVYELVFSAKITLKFHFILWLEKHIKTWYQTFR